MTLAEIKKALECCHTMAVKCDECPLWERKGDWTDGKDCDDVLHEEILKVWDNMVQVVRCSECKYLNIVNGEEVYAFCGNLPTLFYFDGDTMEFYCADGERKEKSE